MRRQARAVSVTALQAGALLVMSALTAGCLDFSPKDCSLKCGSGTPACPPGTECNKYGFCRLPGATGACPSTTDGGRPDATGDALGDVGRDVGRDVGVDASPDAPVPDAPPSPCIHPKVVKSCPKGSLGIEWCTIPAGCFQMGSPTTEPCRGSDEDQHRVTLTHQFELQRTEVTQDQFKAQMPYYKPHFPSCGGSCPAEMVSWHEAAAYCNALSGKMKLASCYICTGSEATVTCDVVKAYFGNKVYNCPGYRLPTEAEWEYAYRAGTKTAFYNGAINPSVCSSCSSVDLNAEKIAWYCYKSSSTTHEVGKKVPNNWGLHDMAGNVWEWCNDWWQTHLGTSPVADPPGASSGSSRVTRGGSWLSGAPGVRAARRYAVGPGGRGHFLGFRLARSIKP